MMAKTYNCIYWWQGGSEHGAWRTAFPVVWPKYKTLEETKRDIERAGFVTRRGNTNIGPPEGPPKELQS